MWSDEVGIHRNTEGQSERFFAAAAAADELISSAILAANSRDNLDHRRGPKLIKLEASEFSSEFDCGNLKLIEIGRNTQQLFKLKP